MLFMAKSHLDYSSTAEYSRDCAPGKKETPEVMRRAVSGLITSLVLVLCFAAPTKTTSSPADTLDHVTSFGPSCPPYPCADIPLEAQVRYLIGHWPRDFKIAVVEATDRPKCKIIADRNQCVVRVRLTDLILGTQEPNEGAHRASWRDPFEINYSYRYSGSAASDPAFVVRPGDHLLAMLTPAIHPPNQPYGYISTRLDHATDAAIQSLTTAVANILTAAAHPDTQP
jgi:hypothetical protein